MHFCPPRWSEYIPPSISSLLCPFPSCGVFSTCEVRIMFCFHFTPPHCYCQKWNLAFRILDTPFRHGRHEWMPFALLFLCRKSPILHPLSLHEHVSRCRPVLSISDPKLWCPTHSQSEISARSLPISSGELLHPTTPLRRSCGQTSFVHYFQWLSPDAVAENRRGSENGRRKEVYCSISIFLSEFWG